MFSTSFRVLSIWANLRQTLDRFGFWVLYIYSFVFLFSNFIVTWINFCLIIDFFFFLPFIFYKFQLKCGFEFSNQGSIFILFFDRKRFQFWKLFITYWTGFLYKYVYICTYMCLYASLKLLFSCFFFPFFFFFLVINTL